MLDQLMSTVGGNVISELTSKAGISEDQAKSVLPLAQESLQSGLMEQVTGGNIDGVLGMFNSGAAGLESNSLFGSIKEKFLGLIMSKLGLPAAAAGLVAGTGMSGIVSGLAGQLGGAGSITQDSLMSGLGLNGGIADLAKGALGGALGGGDNALGGIADAAKGALGGDAGSALGDAASKLGGLFGK